MTCPGPISSVHFRSRQKRETPSLVEFAEKHDSLNTKKPLIGGGTTQVCVINGFSTKEELWARLGSLDLSNSERLRPGWDSYFMARRSLRIHEAYLSTAADTRGGPRLLDACKLGFTPVQLHEAARRGDHRAESTDHCDWVSYILAFPLCPAITRFAGLTRYNGTPRNLTNCNQGGCPRCNGGGNIASGDECLCLHAEENALIEAGRERVGDEGVLYCNTLSILPHLPPNRVSCCD